MGHAFTLVEVLIVVIILGILAAVVVPQFSNAGNDAKQAALDANLQVVRRQLQLYRLHHGGTWPRLAAFTRQMTLSSKTDGTTAAVGTPGYPFGPYLRSIPNNPYTGTNTVGRGSLGSSAWYYDQRTGAFRANHAAQTQNPPTTPSNPPVTVPSRPPPASPFGP